MIAAATACLSASIPAAKLASLPSWADAIHGSRRAASLERIIAWKRFNTSRAATRSGAAVSIVALTSAILADALSR